MGVAVASSGSARIKVDDSPQKLHESLNCAVVVLCFVNVRM